MSDRIVALIRTVVPPAVGCAVTWAAKKLGVAIDSSAIAAASVTAVTGVYYVTASSLERRWPAFGVLLGVPAGPPSYGTKVKSSAATFEDAVPSPRQLTEFFPPGTVITVPDVPAGPATKSFTLTVGPDGAEIVSNERVTPDPSAAAPTPEVTQ